MVLQFSTRFSCTLCKFPLAVGNKLVKYNKAFKFRYFSSNDNDGTVERDMQAFLKAHTKLNQAVQFPPLPVSPQDKDVVNEQVRKPQKSNVLQFSVILISIYCIKF